MAQLIALPSIRLLNDERWTLPLKAPKVSTLWRESGFVTAAEAAVPAFTGRQRVSTHSPQQ